MSVRLILSGAAGRMGRRLVALGQEDAGIELVGALEAPGHPELGQDSGRLAGAANNGVPLLAVLPPSLAADVILDFSLPPGTMARLQEALERKLALITGTTGLSAAQETALKDAAGKIPVLQAPNFSLGVNLLLKLTGQVARVLGEDYDLEILEHHHRHKKDAPSGTAKALAAAAAAARQLSVETDVVHGRKGEVGARPRRQIGVHAVRLGDVTGFHEVLFGAEGETVTLSHRASSRDTFARGALRAAKWIRGRPPGWYTMADVLGW